MKGETITLVANASQLMKGMPAEAKPGQKPGPNAPKIPLDSVDFYRDVNGDGLFNATDDQFLASDADHSDGFTTEVSTAAFRPDRRVSLQFLEVGKARAAALHRRNC